MRIDINSLADIPKLLAFLRARSPSEFHISRELLGQVMETAKAFASKHRIRCEIVAPEEHRVQAFVAGGFVIGALGGLYCAGVAGAAVGGVLGGLGGYFCAHLVLHISPRDDGDFTLIVQPK